MRVLVTGGAGYIGSHTLIELMAQGHEVCVLDNYTNATPEVLTHVRSLSNGTMMDVRGDVRDAATLDRVMRDFAPDAVVHFAGLKAVGESQHKPLAYYDVNLGGTLALLHAMDRAGCRRIIFSSSATVYGEPDYLPYDEAHPTRPTSVYGRTKLMAEQVLHDWAAADPARSAVLLRYFNPVGAHGSARIGEDPKDIPNNLMPYIAQVDVGLRPALTVFGDDYDTPDGTGLRDYIHVEDLASAHIACLHRLMDGDPGDFTTTVGARKLIDILRTMPADQTVSLESSQAKLILKGGKSKFTLQTLPAEDFPLVQEAASFGPVFSVPQKTLKQLLGQVSFAMAVHDIRYYLNGILFVAEGNRLSLVATDGHRLAFTAATLDVEVPTKQEVILPRKTVLELQRLLSDADGAIEMQFANNQAKFSFDGMEFVTKLVEGKFPDYNRVIPKGHRNNLTLGRQALLSCLQRTAILTSDKFKGVRLNLDPGSLRVASTNAEQEEAVDELDIDYGGDAIEIGFNVTYIIDVLSNMGQDMVRIDLADGNSSALITIPENDNFKYVVMPMRI